MYDLLFRHARIVDGAGNPWFRGDVGVEGDRIAAVGDLTGARGKRVIDVEDAILAPGFIDLHTHSDFTLPVYPRAESMVRQGVTTQLVGNCGSTPFPVVPERLEMLKAARASSDVGLSWDWRSAGDYARALERLPLAGNVALQVGHGTVRLAAMGFDNREPTDRELATMERLVAEACEDGVFGFSTGLIYTPGSYAKTDEIVALAKVARRYGAFYSTHPRGEGATLLAAIAEGLTVGREAYIPVQLSHHKALGKHNWGKVVESLAMMDAARAAGMDVLSDVYPYTAGSTALTAVMPQWAMEGGVDALLARLADAGTRVRIRDAISSTGPEILFHLETIMLARVPAGPDKKYGGMMLTDIAADRGEHPAEAALHLLETNRGAAQIIVFVLAEDDVRRCLRHPAIAIASDGSSINPDAPGKPHPRSYGTYVRVLGKYVREKNLLTLPDAIRKMTSLPAQRLRRYDLGLARPGCRADLVTFDPDTVGDQATYAEPHRFATGVHHVVVNGQVVIENGQDTRVAAGRVLRRDQA